MGEPSSDDGESAPWYTIADNPVMGVEHPCVVKNNAKGIDMLGGARALSQNLDLGTDRTLALTFTPNDPSSRTVLSLHYQTNDVLLKVTVPKMTGRKRKRGSREPFRENHHEHAMVTDSTKLVRCMQDNIDSYQIETVGKIQSSHVWRSMPDFVFSSKGSSFMKDVEEKLLPKDFSLMQRFRLQRSYGVDDHEIIPPTVFSTQPTPYHYFYRQNQAILKGAESEGTFLTNRAITTKTFTHQWQYDSPGVPNGPMQGCPPLEHQPQQVQDIVHRLRPILEDRPIWTRRALMNQLPDFTAFFFAKHAIAYVAFTIRSGPWRDTICRFGVDPRTDRRYRKYQTILLQIMQAQKETEQNGVEDTPERRWIHKRDIHSHVFTGAKSVPMDGKVWQLCDIEDEQLKNLVDIDDLYLRADCEIRYFGWYPNGTYAKMRILLKIKVDRLIAGKAAEPDSFERLLQLPDTVDTSYDYQGIGGGDLAQGYLKDASRDEIEWATAFRGIVRTPLGALPTTGSMGKGRTSIAKPKARPSYLAPEQDQDADEVIEGETYEAG